ncbi:MAG TPA: M48 family metallopeptidase [Bacilli bacterium]|nr:M48 family metallopeptidase [Bacilli bacterium]HPS18982.1 M48 family metallopeptidase [Bacilli bacterium]
MTKQFNYIYKGNEYLVNIQYKHNHCISYHFRDGGFLIYCPLFTAQNRIVEGLDKFAVKLIDENPHVLGKGDDFIYLLGQKIELQSSGEILFGDGTIIPYKDQKQLDIRLRQWFLKVMSKRTRFYEAQMGLANNNIKLRKMSTRYGSNSLGNHSITYSTVLMHYSLDVLDAIIIHELAHCLVSGHGPKFYNLVYHYCPNYKALHQRLRKGKFHD